MRTPKTIMKKGRRNGQFTRKTASKSGKEREPHKTEKETKQNCKGISTLRWTTWSLKKVEFLQVAQKENVTGLSVNSNDFRDMIVKVVGDKFRIARIIEVDV